MIVSTPDVSNGSEDTKIKFMTRLNGTDTETLTLNSGKVGIGETSPSQTLHIKGASNTGGIRLANTDVAYYNEIRNNGDGLLIDVDKGDAGGAGADLRINISDSEKMRITNGGDVGIGTTSPASLLHIESNSADPTLRITNKTAAAINTGADIEFWNNPFTGSTSNAYESGAIRVHKTSGTDNNHDHYMSFETRKNSPEGINEHMRITSGGNVFIGDTVNAKATQGLTINQGANDDEILALKSSDVAHGMTDLAETDTYFSLAKASSSQGGVNAQAFSDNTEYAWYMQGATLASANTAKSTSAVGVITMASATKSGTNRTAVTTDGNLVVMKNDSLTRFIFDAEGSGHADVEWTTYSDGRLKTDRETIPYGLDEINKLKPQRYKKQSGGFDKDGNMVLEDNKKTEIGFIAQEVKEIIPELVKDIDESESFYSLNDGKIVAVLVKAVQELSAKVEALENA